MAFTRNGAFEYLSRAHERGRLGHAYLISGPPGSGKRGLACDLSNLLSGTKSSDIFASPPPGVYLAEPESKSRRIVIDQVRTLEHALQMRSANGHRKIAIITDADRLQPQAANAFLKTLEEPPNDSLLLLLSSMPEVLPDTILSRCIAVPLAASEKAEASPEENELVELLGAAASGEGQGIQPAYQLARGFHRLLAQLREAIQEENAAALKRDEARYRNTTDGAWLDEREDFYKALTESQYVRQRSRLVEILFLWWSDVLRASTGVARRELPKATKKTESLASRLKTPEILRRIRRLEEMRDHLGRNIQEALAVEVAFLSVFTW
ncbi:MAG: polymerase subunit delta [Verrucomicrobiota bacterium]|jgi:DNA polymerase-3 subunit delta'